MSRAEATPRQLGTPGGGLQVETVISEVEVLLSRSLRYYPQDLPLAHHARLGGWERSSVGSSTRGAGFLSVLGQQLDACRLQAEAMLVHERLGQVDLDAGQREFLTTRAIGIMPDSTYEQFREVLACPRYHPAQLARSVQQLVTTVEAIEREIGRPAGLAFGMLILAGVESVEELLGYAQKIDRLYEKVTSCQAVVQALDQASCLGSESDGPGHARVRFEVLMSILEAVRRRLWALKPERASSPFLLTQVLNAYAGNQRGVGNSLGLGILDAIIIGKLGFDVRHWVEAGAILLEVPVHHRTVYWSPTDPTGSSLGQERGRRLSLTELFALTCHTLAATYLLRGRTDRAIEQYRRELVLTPDAVDTRNRLSGCYIRARMPEDAIQTAKANLRFDPECADAHLNIGNAYVQMQRWPRAILAFKSAIGLRPDCIEAHNNLGFALYRSGAPQQAIAAYEAAIKIRPDYAEAHFNLGNIYLELERYDDAVRCYREATRLRPNLAQAFYNLGQAWYHKGRLDTAIQNYRRAIDINPKHFGAWHNLGIAYRDKGMKQQAVEALEQAVTLNPNLMR